MGYFILLLGALFLGGAVVLIFLSNQERNSISYDVLRNIKIDESMNKEASNTMKRQKIINQFQDVSQKKFQKSIVIKAQKSMEFENTLELARKRVK